MKDLHIHIERGAYTAQWIEQFIDKAVKEELDEICLLEHSIRFKDFHPTFKEAREYSLYQRKWFDGKAKTAHTLDEFKALADEIRKRDYPIKVSFGLEICWFEQHQDMIQDLTEDGFFDYLLGSVHWVDNWTFNQRKYQWLNKDVNHIYKRYFELEKSLIQSDIFDIIAHPDLIMCHGIYPSYDLTETYDELCKAANAHHVMVEMNSSRGKKSGFNKELLEIALKNHTNLITGSDAHCVADTGKGIEEMTNLIYRK